LVIDRLSLVMNDPIMAAILAGSLGALCLTDDRSRERHQSRSTSADGRWQTGCAIASGGQSLAKDYFRNAVSGAVRGG